MDLLQGTLDVLVLRALTTGDMHGYAVSRWVAGTPLPKHRATAESRLNDMNVALPPAPRPAGVYRPLRRQGNLLYVSGHGPLHMDGVGYDVGKLGKELAVPAGAAAARKAGVATLATLRAELGSLDR